MITASPTGGLDAETITRFRTNDKWLDYDRYQGLLSELVPCDSCEDGIAQREVDDADEGSVSYRAVEGCSSVVETGTRPDGTTYRWRSFFCPACSAANGAAT